MNIENQEKKLTDYERKVLKLKQMLEEIRLNSKQRDVRDQIQLFNIARIGKEEEKEINLSELETNVEEIDKLIVEGCKAEVVDRADFIAFEALSGDVAERIKSLLKYIENVENLGINLKKEEMLDNAGITEKSLENLESLGYRSAAENFLKFARGFSSNREEWNHHLINVAKYIKSFLDIRKDLLFENLASDLALSGKEREEIKKNL